MKNIVLIFFLFACNNVIAQDIQYNYDKANRLVKIIYPSETKYLIYTYDADGNRIQSNVAASQICSGSIASFYSGIANGNVYQWQVNQGTGYNNVNNDAIHSGATTGTILLTNPPTSWYGYTYRCMITTNTGQVYSVPDTLKFYAYWSGNLNTAWNNPSNWKCNVIPDANTDVIIDATAARYPVVSIDAFCRSLSASGAVASVIVLNGSKLTITH